MLNFFFFFERVKTTNTFGLVKNKRQKVAIQSPLKLSKRVETGNIYACYTLNDTILHSNHNHNLRATDVRLQYSERSFINHATQWYSEPKILYTDLRNVPLGYRISELFDVNVPLKCSMFSLKNNVLCSVPLKSNRNRYKIE